MNSKRVFTLIGILLVSSFLVMGFAKPPDPGSSLILNINTKLQPGVWHGWGLGNSAETPGAYLVDVSPVNASKNGAYIERALVQPEFDGYQWNDVLRIMLPEGFKPLKVNVMVYRTADLPLAAEYDAVLEGGVWHGFGVGPSDLEQGYLVEVTPLEASWWMGRISSGRWCSQNSTGLRGMMWRA
jgi:hypothetical protein